MLLDDLIHQRSYSEEDLLKVLSLQDWTPETSFCIVCCEPKRAVRAKGAGKLNVIEALQQNINMRHRGAIALLDGVKLVCCMSIESRKSDETAMDVVLRIPEFRRANGIRKGVSYVYRDFTESFLYYKQALAALEHGCRHDREFTSISECALDACVLNADIPFVLSCKHELIALLRETDRNAGTDYYDTLLCFLRHERSYLETAEELGVHRNTVVYRIDRIQQMCPSIDLDSPYTREYLMFSYQIDRKERAGISPVHIP